MLPAELLQDDLKMGDVLEFQSVRVQLYGFLLRALGVPDAAHWRILGTPRQRIRDGELHAAPLVLAARDGEVCILDILNSPMPAQLTDECRRKAYLDACVVREDCRRKSLRCVRVSVWIVYEDGGRFELTPSMSLLDGLRQRAQRLMRERGSASASTRELAEHWDAFASSTPPTEVTA